MQALAETPVHDSGAWGEWAKLVMGTAKLLGDKAALKALKEGEESGLKEYQDLQIRYTQSRTRYHRETYTARRGGGRATCAFITMLESYLRDTGMQGRTCVSAA